MDALLIVVTALSLLLAIAMGVVLFVMMREERQRADARVALLVAAASGMEPSPTQEPDPALADVAVHADRAVREDLFAARTERSPWAYRLGVAAVFAACVAIGGYIVLPHGPTTPPSAPAVAGAAPLELMTLGHAQESDSLTITGLVHNPRSGVPLKQVTATAFLFGEGDSFLASGKASLDFTILGPGDESPFVIKVPVTGIVTRYRVGFRSADGAVISHVDRRSASTSAHHAAASESTPWAH